MVQTTTKRERDRVVVDYLDSLLAQGYRRNDAIGKTCKKFGILQRMTVYNTELRVRKRDWEERHGKREA